MSEYAEPGVINELPAPTPKDLQIGVDIGGTGIKGGIVDLRTGNLVSDRFRIDTPKPATPAAVAEVVRRVVDELQGRDLAPDPESAVGIDFPAVVKNGMVFSAANVDDSWINTDLEQVMSEALDGRTVYGLNDADAAGLAEATYGQGRNRDGLIAVITLGTGIGSALINDGVLIPNTELGHLEIDGHNAESQASVPARCTSCPGRSTASACTATSSTFRCSSPPTCSSLAAASPRTRRSSCPTLRIRFVPPWSWLPCVTTRVLLVRHCGLAVCCPSVSAAAKRKVFLNLLDPRPRKRHGEA